jgi:hypothetical protein
MRNWLIKKLKGYTKKEIDKVRVQKEYDEIMGIFMAYSQRQSMMSNSCVSVITNEPIEMSMEDFKKQFSIREEDIERIKLRPPSIKLKVGIKYDFHSPRTFNLQRFKGARTNGFIFFDGSAQNDRRVQE